MAIFDFLNSQQTGTQTTSNLIDPQLKQAYLQNLQAADAIASRPYEQYGGPRIAGFNADQNQAFQGVRDMQGGAMPFLQGAANTYQNLMGFNAPQVNYNGAGAPAMASAQGYNPALANRAMLGQASQVGAAGINRGNVRDINGGSFLAGNINAYQNPYQQGVIDQVQNDLERQKTLDLQRANAQAIASKAFGGSRGEIAKQEINRNYADQFARTSAQLRNQGFDTAANLMQGDINRGLQAQQANQSADMNVASQNAGFQQNANLANQQANNQFALSQFGNDASLNQFNAANQNAANQFGASANNANSQFNTNYLNQFALNNANQNFAAQQANQNAALASAGVRSGAAGNFGNIGVTMQGQRTNDINALMQSGALQQNQVQRNYDLANQDFQNQFNYPIQAQALRQSALSGGLPNLGSQTQTPIYQNQLGNLLGLGTGLNSIFGNDKNGNASFLSGAVSSLGNLFKGLI